jgi:DNA-binding response OmpR family regulator
MRILIADRHPEERESPERILRAAGHATRTVADARTLPDEVRRNPYDAVVMRLETPPTDALLAYRTLRSDLRSTDLPVIFCIVSETDPSDAASALAAGADFVLVEPLDPERLLEAVRTVAAPARDLEVVREGLAKLMQQPADLQREPSVLALLHELSNAITALVGHAEMLRAELDPAAPPATRANLAEMVQLGARASNVVQLLKRRASAGRERGRF